MAVCFRIVFAHVHLRNRNISSVFASSLLMCTSQVAPMAVCFCIVFVQHKWSLPVAPMGVCFCIVFANVHLRNRNISSVFASDLYKWPQWPSVFASSLCNIHDLCRWPLWASVFAFSFPLCIYATVTSRLFLLLLCTCASAHYEYTLQLHRSLHVPTMAECLCIVFV